MPDRGHGPAVSSGSPTDGDRTDTSHTGLKVPVAVILGCVSLLALLIVLAVAVS